MTSFLKRTAMHKGKMKTEDQAGARHSQEKDHSPFMAGVWMKSLHVFFSNKQKTEVCNSMHKEH